MEVTITVEVVVVVVVDLGVVVTTSEFRPLNFFALVQNLDSHHDPELDVAAVDVSGTDLRVGVAGPVVLVEPFVATTILYDLLLSDVSALSKLVSSLDVKC